MSYKPIPTLDSNNATFIGDINTCTNILSGGTDIADIFALASTTGDITAVIAGTGLTGGGTSGSVTLNLSAGDGVQATANCVSVDSTVVRTSGNQTIAGDKTFNGSALCVSNVIRHTGDPDTCIAFSTNGIALHAGGECQININSTGVIINEPGNSNDFRVEGDTDTHALFVDGSTDNVGIGTATPSAKFEVLGGSGDTARFEDDTQVSVDLKAGSASNYIVGLPAGDLSFRPNSTALMHLDGSLGYVGIGDTTPSHVLDVNGTLRSVGGAYFNTDATVSNNIYANNYIYLANSLVHSGDTNTYLSFATDNISLVAGGEDSIDISTGGVVINEGGLANDFRVEGDTDTHALFVDGSKDNVGIGTSSTENNSKLTVTTSDTTALSTLLRVGSTSANQDYTALRFGNTSSTQYGDYGFSLNYEGTQSGNNNRFVWYADNQTGSGGQCIGLSMLQDGSVGIGTASPASKLDVAGSINATGSFKLDDSDVINSGKCFVGTAIADAYIASAACWNACATSTQGTKADNALPKAGGTMTGQVNYNNNNIIGVNIFCFADPGPNEGIHWTGGNTKIFESPDNLTTNSAGNLQMVYGTTRRLTVNNTGIDVNGNIVVSGCVDGRDVAADGTKLDGIACGATANTGDITQVVAGTNLTGGGTSGCVTINAATGGAGAGAYGSTADNIKIDTICLDAYGRVTCITTGGTGCGDITGVVAGTGMTGGATSGSATLNVIGGTGITANANDVAIDTGVVMNLASAQTASGTKNFSGSICVGANIYHSGDSNTSLQFNPDSFCIYTGGEQHICFNNSGIVVNESGNSNDFRVESDTNTHMLFVDGSANAIGINCSTPSATLAVNGSFVATCKSFLVDNPVTGGQLKYGVVEGNEHGVTVRGSTCCGTIDLPAEWDWLVHEDSVTAQITPVGGPHQPYIVSQDNKRVVVCSDGCYNYNIYGTRKDVEPLEVNIL